MWLLTMVSPVSSGAALLAQDVVSFDPLACTICFGSIYQEDGRIKPVAAMLLARPGIEILTRYGLTSR